MTTSTEDALMDAILLRDPLEQLANLNRMAREFASQQTVAETDSEKPENAAGE